MSEKRTDHFKLFERKRLPGLFGQLRTGINIIVAAVSGKSNERLLKLYKRNSPAGLLYVYRLNCYNLRRN